MSKTSNINFFSLSFILITFQIIFYFIIFKKIYHLSGLNIIVDIYDGDASSYLDFKFGSITENLSNFRSIGLPIILKIFKNFDPDLLHWPKFNYFFYCTSCLLLFYAVNNLKVDILINFFFVFFLIISKPIFEYLNYWTEVISISTIIISISFFFIAYISNKKLYFVLFSLFLFISYQIRPSFVLFIFYPFIFYILNNLCKINFKYFFMIFLYTVLPLLLFLSLRFYYTNHLGIVPFGGFGVSGNAVYLLEKEDIKKLSINNQTLAYEILKAKKNLNYPCNLDKHELNSTEYKKNLEFGEYPCWSVYANTAIFKILEIDFKLTPPLPINDKTKNDNPLNYSETRVFFNQLKNFNEIDIKLYHFSKEVYFIYYKDVLKKILKSPIYFFKLQLVKYKKIYFIFITTCFLFLTMFFFRSKFLISYLINYEITYKNNIIFIISFILLTILKLILLYGNQTGETRSVIVQCFYFTPAICSLFLIFYLKKLKDFIN